MEDKISIIIPVYNVEKYIKKCVDSIINQTYKNLEIILVDDGSSDNSGKICDEYKKRDYRIKVIHKENGGLSDARNKGVEIATGKYIGFVDSDDYIEENMYNILLNELKVNNADVSICSYKKIREDYYKVDCKQSCEKIIKILDNIKAIELLLSDTYIDNYAWNKLYKKELFNNIKYPYGKKMEDLGTTYKIFSKAKKIVYTNYIGYFYLQRNSSILHNIDANFIQDIKELINERYLDIIKEYPEMKTKADINRLKYIKTYFMHIAKNKRKDLTKTKEYKKEYEFFKSNYKKYKKDLSQNSLKERILYLTFYYNLPLFIKIYELKG